MRWYLDKEKQTLELHGVPEIINNDFTAVKAINDFGDCPDYTTTEGIGWDYVVLLAESNTGRIANQSGRAIHSERHRGETQWFESKEGDRFCDEDGCEWIVSDGEWTGFNEEDD